MEATYSPQDNKLRLYPAARLDEDTYARVRDAGYRWAPKQELFVAPMWTPEREDLALELAGEIEDETMSLEERAADRAERFRGYSGRRAAESEALSRKVDRLAGVMNGQPILVGHHSEKRHRRDYDRMWDDMRKSAKLWRTSEYWKGRAAASIRDADYKERRDVRERRIKKLEAEQRSHRRDFDEAEAFGKLWNRVKTVEQALAVANRDRMLYGAWSRLNSGELTADDAREEAIAGKLRVMERAHRWIEHLERRLEYERAILETQGGPTPTPKRAKLPPLLNYPAETVTIRSLYHSDPQTYPQVAMTKAEYKRIWTDNKATRPHASGTHRVRTAMIRRNEKLGLYAVYLSDSKTHPTPEEVSA